MQLLADGLRGCRFTWSHLHTVWDWKGLARFDMPAMIHLNRVHAINFYRPNGIWVKWKQYMTSEEWSSPVLLIPSHEIPLIAAWRPTVTQHAYSETDQRSKVMMVANWAADTRPTSSYRGRAPRVLVVQQARKGDLLHGQVVAGRSQHTRLDRG